MKRRFFNVLLFGALLGASTGVFVSCAKDYDDDINGLKSEVNSLTATLAEAKSGLEAQIVSLKSQLETAQAELNLAIEQAKEAGDQAAANYVQDRVAAVAALEAKLEAAEGTLAAFQSATEAELAELAGKLNAIESTLGSKITEAISTHAAKEEAARNAILAELTQAKAELEMQKSAFAKANEKLAALEVEIPAIKNDIEAARANIANLTTEVSALSAKVEQALSSLNTDIDDLKNAVRALAAKVDSNFSGDGNLIQLWVNRQLRSLVFAPRCYYYGIEAAKIVADNGFKYILPDVKSELEDVRYDSLELFTSNLDESVATYHMNPSTANIDLSRVKIAEVVDAEYSRGLSDVNLEIADKYIEGGDLKLKLHVPNLDKLKTISSDPTVPSKVTVFAVEYQDPNDSVTITSDYVALIAQQTHVRYKIAHTADASSLVKGVKSNTDCLSEPGHLMQTKKEAKSNEAQDTCNWAGSIDLNKCVQLHKFVEGTEQAEPVDLTQGEYQNYVYEFELTPNVIDGVDNSEYASITNGILKINDVKGKYSSIGKKPLVRVSIKDGEGNVLDYGYILCEIADNICHYVKSAAVDWSKGGINPTYWFAEASWNPGTAEIHINTMTPEDNLVAAPTALPLSVKLANTFLGNKVDTKNGLVTVVDEDGDPFSLPVNNVKFIFHNANDTVTYLADGKMYTLKVVEDGQKLNAVGEDKKETVIAVLTGTNVDNQVITYQTTDVAKALLNIASRDNLKDEIKAYVGLDVATECDVKVKDNPLIARFIRPINVTAAINPVIIVDASATKLQTVELESLLQFDDWRKGQTWKPEYKKYYGVQSVEILGSHSGDKLRDNLAVKTDQGGDGWKPLHDVNDAVDLVYKVAADGTAYIEYRNNQAGVNEFQLQIPVSVRYIWGTFTEYITVKVQKTA